MKTVGMNVTGLKALIASVALAAASIVLGSSQAPVAFCLTTRDGHAVFQQRCAMCHGEDGKGKPNWKAKGQPDFTDEKFQRYTSDKEIADAIENGKGRYMPGFKSKISAGDITDLVHQVRAFGKK